jgi:hypothetical protein
MTASAMVPVVFWVSTPTYTVLVVVNAGGVIVQRAHVALPGDDDG